MADVVNLDMVTRLDLPPNRILEAAKDEDLQMAIVIGLDADGDFYFASSDPDGGNVLWQLEMARVKLIEIARGMSE